MHPLLEPQVNGGKESSELGGTNGLSLNPAEDSISSTLATVLERLTILETKYQELQTKIGAPALPRPSDFNHGRAGASLGVPPPLPPPPPSYPPPPPPPLRFPVQDEDFEKKETIFKVKSEDWAPSRISLSKLHAQGAVVVSMCKQSHNGIVTQPMEHTKDAILCPTDDAAKDATKTDFSDRTPDRVAISDQALMDEIQNIAKLTFAPTENSILSPFKSLVTYHEEYKKSLATQLELTDKLEAEKKDLEEKQISAKKDEESKDEDIVPGDKIVDGDITAPDVTVESKPGQPVAQEPPSEDSNSEFGNERPPRLVGGEPPAAPAASEAGAESVFSLDEEIRLADVETELRRNKILINGLKGLLHFLEVDLKATMELRSKITNRTVEEIAFDDLWHLYKPGDIVITSDQRQAYRVLHITGGRVLREPISVVGKVTAERIRKSNFILDCMYIDFNGREFGPTPKVITITPYTELRQISALEVYPMSFLGEEKALALEDKLVSRGKKFSKLARVAHKRYAGLSIKEGSLRYEEIDSDVMIDFALGYKNSYKEGYEIEVPAFDQGILVEATFADIKENEAVGVGGCGVPDCYCTGYKNVDDSQFELRRRNKFLDGSDLLELRTLERSKHDKEKGKLDRNRLVLLPIRVIGYVFLNRKWYPLDIDNVRDIEERGPDERDGFAELVLPEGHKDIVRALVKTFAKPASSVSGSSKAAQLPQHQLDIVRGKGRGLIILLHGVPGVGKTSTAECVAANTRRPLFPITCGDIGATSAKDVETNLESYFELAHKWGCVLLLDEADVFLGERTKGDIVQNSLVSVFLRVLEYYKGILILTTNRVGEFDEAIRSRIHIALYYPKLNRASTMQIWDNNLENIRKNKKRPIYFSEKDIKNFARLHWTDCEKLKDKPHWNGRQIKNAFQTAIALAEWDHLAAVDAGQREKNSPPMLESRHFDTVKDASQKFDSYLTIVRGKTDSVSAKEKGLRQDRVNAKGELVKGARSQEYMDRQKQNGFSREASTVEMDMDGDSDEVTEDTDDNFERTTAKEREARLREDNERKARLENEKRIRKEQRARKKKEKEMKEAEAKKKSSMAERGGESDESSSA